MKKTFLRFAAVGMAVAFALAQYAYYNNRHHGGPPNDLVYMILCPPSIFLMLTDNASVPEQASIVTLVAVENEVLYGVVGMVILGSRRLTQRRPGNG